MTTYSSETPTQGQPVNTGETMLRFAAPAQWDRLGRPTSAALTIKSDEDGLSIYLRDLLATRSLGETDVVANRRGYGVLAMPVASAVAHGCTVHHEPVLATRPDPIGFAHALVIPPREKTEWKLARAALLADAHVLIPPG